MDYDYNNQQLNNVSKLSGAKVIKDLQSCANVLDTSITIVKKALLYRKQLSNDSNIDTDLQYLDSQYLPNVEKFKKFVTEELNESNLYEALLPIQKLLMTILKTFVSNVIFIIERHNMNSSAVVMKAMADFPVIITQLLKDVTSLIDVSTKKINQEKDLIEYKYSGTIDNKNHISDKVGTSGSNESFTPQQEAVIDSISDTLSVVINQALRIFTLRNNSINNALDRINGNLHSLSHQITTSFGNGNKDITWADIKGFFTSDAFVSTVTGIVACTALFIGMKKLIRELLTRIRRLFD